ncbi:MAG: hypothetical protein NZ934_00515 [Hadesarchaea archaeon]|nr:hypothetical protein [Hadesarchaea archaeon]
MVRRAENTPVARLVMGALPFKAASSKGTFWGEGWVKAGEDGAGLAGGALRGKGAANKPIFKGFGG